MVKIRSRYSDPDVRCSLDTGSESYVQQQFKNDCDIHVIVNKFRQGLPVKMMEHPPQYGDFSDVQDFKEAQNLIASTTQFFESLPSDLRARFGNNPASFLEFVNDPANEDEAVKLGILKKAQEELLSDSEPVVDTKPLSPSQETPVTGSEVKEVAP